VKSDTVRSARSHVTAVPSSVSVTFTRTPATSSVVVFSSSGGSGSAVVATSVTFSGPSYRVIAVSPPNATSRPSSKV